MTTIDRRYEPGFRPKNYWDEETAFLANMEGQWRREREEQREETHFGLATRASRSAGVD